MGKIYDKLNSTFLFHLNEDYVIDGTRKGSVARFGRSKKHIML